MDELVYYKVDENLYSGGFRIHSILNNSFHDNVQSGGGKSISSLAVPLGLYSASNTTSPVLKKLITSSEMFLENNSYSNKRKTKKIFK